MKTTKRRGKLEASGSRTTDASSAGKAHRGNSLKKSKKPEWLQRALVPDSLAKQIEILYSKKTIPPVLKELLGLLYFAMGSHERALSLHPSIGDNAATLRDRQLEMAVRLLKEARDNILLAVPRQYVSIVQFRLERLIEATSQQLRSDIHQASFLLNVPTEEEQLRVNEHFRGALYDAAQLWRFVVERGQFSAIEVETSVQSLLKVTLPLVSLTADHETILAYLQKCSPRCKKVQDVCAASTIKNRETVGKLLRDLLGMGLVCRPHGVKKGYCLTENGRKMCSQA